MNENLFNETAKLQADRNQVEGQRELVTGGSGSTELEIGRRSRQLLGFRCGAAGQRCSTGDIGVERLRSSTGALWARW